VPPASSPLVASPASSLGASPAPPAPPPASSPLGASPAPRGKISQYENDIIEKIKAAIPDKITNSNKVLLEILKLIDTITLTQLRTLTGKASGPVLSPHYGEFLVINIITGIKNQLKEMPGTKKFRLQDIYNYIMYIDVTKTSAEVKTKIKELLTKYNEGTDGEKKIYTKQILDPLN
jgi:hypothetical protein